MNTCAKFHRNRLKTVASRPELTSDERINSLSRRIGAFARSVNKTFAAFLFLSRFSPNSTRTLTLPYVNWFWKCTWFHVQTYPKYSFLFPGRFSPNSTRTLTFANWFWKCSWFQIQACPRPTTDFLFLLFIISNFFED